MRSPSSARGARFTVLLHIGASQLHAAVTSLSCARLPSLITEPGCCAQELPSSPPFTLKFTLAVPFCCTQELLSSSPAAANMYFRQPEAYGLETGSTTSGSEEEAVTTTFADVAERARACGETAIG